MKKNLEEPSRRARMMCILDEIKLQNGIERKHFSSSIVRLCS